MEARTILLFISAILIVGSEGTDSVTNGEQRHKRSSDERVLGSVHETVVDYLDGLDILKKFKEIETQFEEIKKLNSKYRNDGKGKRKTFRLMYLFSKFSPSVYVPYMKVHFTFILIFVFTNGGLSYLTRST